MIFNHNTYSLSKNDLKMVKSVPQGGNWRNIPKSIPSKRLDRIRETGGRTTLYGRLQWDKPSYTITTYFNRPGNGTYIHPDHDRLITAREAARLQTFPDNYRFFGSKTSFLKQIGNAVPPILAYFIAKKVKSVSGTSNVLDLFCGAGGLSLGFEWAGYNIIAANDNFSAACETYRKNNPDINLIEGDITASDTKKKIYNVCKNKKIDLVVGGPPCQGFSYAGKRLANDPRNFLYKEYIELIGMLKPKVVVMENVEGIITSSKGKIFKNITNDFIALGYQISAKKIHAVKYGVPQLRKRVVIIAAKTNKIENYFPNEIITNDEDYLTVRDAIGNISDLDTKIDDIPIRKKPASDSILQSFLSSSIPISTFENYINKN